MNTLRSLLVVMLGSLASYTLIVTGRVGWNPLPSFVGDIVALIWPGQLHLALMYCLLLAGAWIAWRHQFTVAGVVLGALAVAGGVLFLVPYLLVISFRVQGDAIAFLLGETRAHELTVHDP